ncbi:hypothetical protein M0R88_03075 [Halorussus gelatinilyticus]|uniref:Uncharacterized protein n=1 Tax=Halorussus gelatinilyticus TaxID=2937524 RepID=A0A8U0IL81_9EURY|nr:hypothetical protein [Halorussus gelatinilyticus]UPW01092.1 hypothetical protein M0R88_03075 [Halorussus gelatinilyticus]
MEIRKLALAQLPIAVVASIAIAAYNLYTGEITTLVPLVIDFLINTVLLIVAFVVADVVWDRMFDKDGM